MPKKQKWIKYLKIFGITFVVLMILDFSILQSRFGLYFTLINAFFSSMIWVGCEIISDIYGDRFSWVDKPYHRLAIIVTATFLWLVVVYLLMMFFWFIPKYGLLTKEHLSRINFRNFKNPLVITSIISLFMYSRGFWMDMKKHRMESIKLEQEKSAFQYEMLRNQVNPHFLFNNLNVLSTLVHKDADLAEQFIAQMSKVYRYVLDNRMQEVVSIKEELNQLESYLYLMKIRFGETFTYTIDIADLQKSIVPMTLQMLVENIFKHNEASANKKLHISIRQEDHSIIVENTINAKKNSEAPSGVGLQNIKDRYQFLTNSEILVSTENNNYRVKIPIIS